MQQEICNLEYVLSTKTVASHYAFEQESTREETCTIYFKEWLWVGPNTCTTINLDTYKLENAETDCCRVITNQWNKPGLHVAKILIDSDLFDQYGKKQPYILVLNTTLQEICVKQVAFKITTFWFLSNEPNIHTWPVFYIEEENFEAPRQDALCGFKKGSKMASGLDLIFDFGDKEFSKIYPLQILDLPLKFYFYTSTIDYQHLFIMRSRFARQGIFCHFDTIEKRLSIVNNSHSIVDLTNCKCFYQHQCVTPVY